MKLVEANDDTWLVTSADGGKRLRIKRPSGFEASFYAAEVIHFAGGSLELRPTLPRSSISQAVASNCDPRNAAGQIKPSWLSISRGM